MSAEARIDLAELRTLFLFEGLTEEQLRFVADRSSVRAYPENGVVFREGEPSDALWVLLDGTLRLIRHSEDDDVLVNETDHRGAYAGAVRAFASSAAQTYQSSLIAVRPSRFLRFPADDFAAFIQRWFPMAKHLFDGLYVGIQAAEGTVRQREHLAQLGRLSASLAHELNNPAAATVRASGQLRARVAHMRHKLGMIAEGLVEPTTLARLIAIQEAAVERASKKRDPLTPIQVTDLEDELTDHLESLGVTGAIDLAPVFVAAGLDPTWVDDVAADVGPDLESALRWLGYTLETEALMDEIEEASARISTLVESVKQYSHMDQAAHQEIDIHPGIDSTLTMLGHKLAGIEIRRDYDDALPRVPAYAAELNQVWTNLIDNAVDAMDGTGVLTVRTYRDADAVAVDVQDTGTGIPAEVRSRVFDAFVTTKAAGKGSGLGLDNAKRIIERRHRGSLTFVTGSDGTTFTARLPLTAR
ncbi:ATP-binding protein [Phytoactinopolyspora halotolerans]|uniref:histidine kinase n=1 Tax=Phytoactinopolyspora halotolerans TaxID=1981512 RepID=A0A6L9S923_9ACTN|nr:ATP-binding protein [Phytoactinopolyspora halotolerans]NEE01092.1 cyclic nucleotide-binding domain-containing protein [Phytoactinopolyspora halotolerans]